MLEGFVNTAICYPESFMPSVPDHTSPMHEHHFPRRVREFRLRGSKITTHTIARTWSKGLALAVTSPVAHSRYGATLRMKVS